MQDIDRLGRAADVQEAGTAVSYDLPRRLTLPTDNDKTQRTRIATVDPTSKFVYGAQPLVTEDVFLRGDLTNSSAYQLLPGPAQIFMGADFIGQTGMPSVAPKDEFSVYFGPDRALKATRRPGEQDHRQRWLRQRHSSGLELPRGHRQQHWPGGERGAV
ncbi:MAG: hypothetical protein U0636_01185 [Phycisphaerales bacterium]